MGKKNLSEAQSVVRAFLRIYKETMGTARVMGRSDWGREMGCAKTLLERCEGDVLKAEEVIQMWAADDWGPRNAPSLQHVLYKTGEYLTKLNAKLLEEQKRANPKMERSSGAGAGVDLMKRSHG